MRAIIGIFAFVFACCLAHSSEVISVIERNDAPALREMLSRDPSLANPGTDRQNPRFGHPLIYASRLGHNECVAALVDAGADIAVRSRHGESALTIAAREGHASTVRLLIELGADARAADRHTSPLIEAARKGCTESALAIIDAGADPALDVRGRTPLSDAAGQHKHEVIRLILERLPPGPLAAASQGDAEALARHIAAGDRNAFVSPRNEVSVAHVSASADSVECMELLRAAGFDIFAPNRGGDTPLHFAASAGALASAEYLLPQGASLEAAAWQQSTPLWSAVRRSQVEMTRYLIGRGASTSSRDYLGSTLLSHAIGLGDTELARALIEGDADVNLPDIDGNTPLHRAIRQFFRSPYRQMPEDDPAYLALERVAISLLRRGALTRTGNRDGLPPSAYASPRHRSMLAQWERRSPETARDFTPEERCALTGLESLRDLPREGHALVIIPMGDADSDLVSKAAGQLKEMLGIPVVVEPQAVELEPQRLISRESQGRTQLYVESVAAAAVSRMGWHGRRNTAHIAVLAEDIYTPSTNYVFATTVPRCHLAVLSYSRFQSGSRDLLEARLRKQLMASFGRVLSIGTCSDSQCPLSTTTHVNALDAKFDLYCDACSDTLEKLLGQRPRPFSPARGRDQEDVF